MTGASWIAIGRPDDDGGVSPYQRIAIRVHCGLSRGRDRIIITAQGKAGWRSSRDRQDVLIGRTEPVRIRVFADGYPYAAEIPMEQVLRRLRLSPDPPLPVLYPLERP